MARLAFPCWTLRAAESEACVTEKSMVVFSSVELATAYLKSCLSGRGELKLVSRQSMRRLVTDIQQRGLEGIRLDPKPDGSGGEQIPLADVLSEFS